jgi:hypothetical protein
MYIVKEMVEIATDSVTTEAFQVGMMAATYHLY